MRKVHRYGFARAATRSGWRGARTGERSQTRAACGVLLYPGTPDVGRGIPDEAFANLPGFAQCTTCLYREPRAKAPRPGGYAVCLPPDADIVWEGGVSSMETMFLAFARMALDLVELGPTWRHRCYHRMWQSGEHSLIEPCGGCGAVSLLDVVTWNVVACGWHPLHDSREQVREEDSKIETTADGTACWGTWCRRCLRVVGEWHKPDCRIPRVTAAEERLVKACGFSPNYDTVDFLSGIRRSREELGTGDAP